MNASLDDLFAVLTSQDFDGHTEFEELSIEMKLAWLSNMARFIWEARQSSHSNE